jgi:tRNA uridine 5-carboxymethylaminomethyl modification enzyme
MHFDIIVIGGGHAGIEAAFIASKKPLSILLITSHIDLIGQMSCNPAIGGIAKGTIVREIDALGGIMGKIADRAGIHFRMLNQSKGMAVWGPRAQADKKAYRFWARKFLEQQANISILQGMVVEIRADDMGNVESVVMDSGEEIHAKAVVITAGTFLNGTAHIGLNSFPSGRLGEPPSLRLTESIAKLGIKSGRLKTGTSPRIDGRSVDFSKLKQQPGDENPWPFSFSTQHQVQSRAVCWESRTNQKTHDIIRGSLDRSPLYTGKITSAGPRYCPSIEDKVIRFGDRCGHTLFLEPEGFETSEMYLNGLSTSLPFDVQIKMVRSIDGFENARILRPGYGIEYDYFQPLRIKATLESKTIANLFFAGQVNGTSGYEEAGCQGLIAGINAAANIQGEQKFVLGRETSYIGVLIDDLVTRGTEEPYRMFSSRAEYRLLLRQDNADQRLMPLSWARGILDREIWESRQRVWEEKQSWTEKLDKARIAPDQWACDEEEMRIKQVVAASELLKRPQINIDDVLAVLGQSIESREIRCGIEADIKYQGFIAKQEIEIERMRQAEQARLPEKIDYSQIQGLLAESKIKLAKARPETLGQASRIPGVTPADITVLMIHLAQKSSDRDAGAHFGSAQ